MLLRISQDFAFAVEAESAASSTQASSSNVQPSPRKFWFGRKSARTVSMDATSAEGTQMHSRRNSGRRLLPVCFVPECLCSLEVCFVSQSMFRILGGSDASGWTPIPPLPLRTPGGPVLLEVQDVVLGLHVATAHGCICGR